MTRPHRSSRAFDVMGVTLFRRLTLLAASFMLVSATAACSSGSSGGDAGLPSAPPAPPLGHVHGLGVDPADGTLYVASHTGVYRVPVGGTAERVADRYQDTMGFAVVGPGHFLASGHPDLREELPGQLGLIESTDAAKTWTALSLEGKADFHAIEPAGKRIYAYDSVGGALVTSSNRRDWTVMERIQLLDLAANPSDPGDLFATTLQGEVLRSKGGSELAPVTGAPRLGPLDWQPGGPLVGVGADGAVSISSDDGATWTKRGTVEGGVEALDVTPGQWYVATDRGIFKSIDGGQTWTPVVMASAQH